MSENNDKEIFERLRSIETTVARIDERESVMLPSVRDHETRIRTLETESAKRKGFLVAVASVASVIVNAILYVIKFIFTTHTTTS